MPYKQNAGKQRQKLFLRLHQASSGVQVLGALSETFRRKLRRQTKTYQKRSKTSTSSWIRYQLIYNQRYHVMKIYCIDLPHGSATNTQVLYFNRMSLLSSITIYTCFTNLQAKQMVTLSKNISTKIREKQGDITEDEVELDY